MKFLFIVLYFLSLVYTSLELRPSHCPTPRLPNGRIRFRQRTKFVKYTCNVGFILSGDRYSNCVFGKWDSPVPKCVRPGCRKVNPPKDGLIYPSHMNAVLHFYCKSGFNIHGPNVTYCNGTSWSANMPICLQSSSKPSLSCDFEKPDICGWTHDLNHDFDWRRMQFSTPSGAIGTGPSFDHTYGEDKGGYYMYIESSSRSENDTARLISPVYDKANNNTCFQFYYHMYGTTIGSLRVYLKMINETWNLDPSKAFFEKHGNQGNQWIGHNHLFGSISNDYQIIIEGVRGTGYVSDIAIDDVKIIENCSIEELQEAEMSTTTEIEEYSTTDFLPDDVFSCENRCFSTEIMVGKHRICACDEGCYDRNNCCPDFIDFCLLHGGSSSTNSEYYTSDESIYSTTEKTSSTQTRKTIVIEDELTTERKISRTTIRKIGTTSTTQRIYIPEMITTKNYPQAEITTVTTTRDMNLQKITTHNEKTKTTTENNKAQTETENEKNIKMNTELSNEIPQIPNDMVPIEDVAHLTRKYNEKITILIPKEGNNSSLYLSLCGVALILGILVAIFVRRRKELRSRGFRSASHGDSASDVRFLTSDELLDLNLEY